MELPSGIILNEEKKRFELETEGQISYVNYSWDKDVLALTFIYVPPALRGRGIAEDLATRVMEYVREKNLKISLYCSWLAGFVSQHPEYSALRSRR